MKRIFGLSPNSSGLIDVASKSLTTVDGRTNPVETDHPTSSFLNLLRPVPEEPVRVPTHIFPIATCHSGDVPAILVTPPTEESANCMVDVQKPINVHISAPQSNPDVRVEGTGTHATGMQYGAVLENVTLDTVPVDCWDWDVA